LGAYLLSLGLETQGTWHGNATPLELICAAPIFWSAAALAICSGNVSWSGTTLHRKTNPVSFWITTLLIALFGALFAGFGAHDLFK